MTQSHSDVMTQQQDEMSQATNQPVDLFDIFIIKLIAKEAGCPRADEMSAHSLRRGFATEVARKGASMPAIQKHGRWKSTQTVLEYIEAGREFKDSAVNVLFE